MPELFKFLRDDMSSPMGRGTYVAGRWRSVRGALIPCERGLHATTADNLVPFLNAALWRAEVDGELLWHEDGNGRKVVARRLRVTDRVEAWNERTARLFAADCTERVLPIFEAAVPGDGRPRHAIAVARAYAKGEATREELAAAGSAAWAAARAAAWDAARAAAWDAAWAAAEAAARTAAMAAAGDAAGDAARTAARAAARAAAEAAAAAAAAAAERRWQNLHLATMLGLIVDAEGVR